jgi:hypothetical protein
MTGFPCGTHDEDLAAQYNMRSALAKSGGQAQFPPPVPVQKQRLTTHERFLFSFAR